MRTWLKKNLLIIGMIFLIILFSVTYSDGAKTIPAGLDPVKIISESNAGSSEGFSQYTSLEFAQSTGNLTLPLSIASLEKNTQSNAIGYHENGQSFGGNATYNGYLNLDTNNKGTSGQNLETARELTFNANQGGRLSFREDVSNSDIAYVDLAEVSLCPSDTGVQTLPSTTDERVSAGGSVDASQVEVNSFSGTRAISTTGAPAGVTYGITARGTGGNSSKGVGNAKSEAHVSSITSSGTTAINTLSYDDITEVSGLFELSKTFSYSS